MAAAENKEQGPLFNKTEHQTEQNESAPSSQEPRGRTVRWTRSSAKKSRKCLQCGKLGTLRRMHSDQRVAQVITATIFPILSSEHIPNIQEGQEKRSQKRSALFMLRQALRAAPPNYVKTTKYTVFTFLPLNLFGQFRRLSNMYFLLAAIFCAFSTVPVSPFSVIAPLVLILGVTALKDGLEEYARYRADDRANSQPCTILQTDGKRVKTETMYISPGTVVVLENKCKVPADLVLISSSNDDGTCYIETSQLDGESALKRKVAPRATCYLSSDALFSNLKGKVEFEAPNSNMTRFQGRLLSKNSEDAETVSPLCMDQFLPRGSILRNTEYAYGVAVYTGKDSKVMQNSAGRSLKFSTFERRINGLVFLAFLWNAAIVAVSVVMEGIQWLGVEGDHWYLYAGSSEDGTSVSEHYLYSFMTFFVVYSYTIPVSLFVMIEIFRVIQSKFIAWDEELVSSKGVKGGVTVRNSNLNEDLGRVDIVFSDKTGTLTQNKMVLQSLWVPDLETVEASKLNEQYKSQPKDSKLNRLLNCILACNEAIPTLSNNISNDAASSSDSSKLEGMVSYESQSPDEVALLKGVRSSAVIKFRKKEKLVIQYENESECTWRVLQTIVFESSRKRMSVIVQDDQGRIFVYTKGGDDVVGARIVEGPEIALMQTAVKQFSSVGLRTLVFAERELSETEYSQMQRDLEEAKAAVTNREEKLAAAADQVECKMQLLGCSAVEDKLQDNVPEGIRFLQDCGIKVWLLTGDKMETAENVARSCNLISSDPNSVLHITCPPGSSSLKETRKFLVEQLRYCQKEIAERRQNALQKSRQLRSQNSILSRSANFFFSKSSIRENQAGAVSIVVAGAAMEQFLGSIFEKCLAQLCLQSSAVVFSRVTPLQKAKIVRMARRYRYCHAISKPCSNDQPENLASALNFHQKMQNLVTERARVACRWLTIAGRVRRGTRVGLSIGDGANDVSMIMQADIGVGIQGVEGAQAARASDYALVEFQQLVPLLAVHGRHSLQRLSWLIGFSFYKNLVFITAQFLYGALSMWSGSVVYNSTFYAYWNVIYTVFPSLVHAITDQDVQRAELLQLGTRLYPRADRMVGLSRTVVTQWTVDTVMHLTVLCVFTLFAASMEKEVFEWIASAALLGIVLGSAMRRARSITEIAVWAHLASWMIFVLTMLFLEFVAPYVLASDAITSGTEANVYSSAVYWLVLFVAPVAALLPETATSLMIQEARPTPEDDARVRAAESKRNARVAPV